MIQSILNPCFANIYACCWHHRAKLPPQACHASTSHRAWVQSWSKSWQNDLQALHNFAGQIFTVWFTCKLLKSTKEIWVMATKESVDKLPGPPSPKICGLFCPQRVSSLQWLSWGLGHVCMPGSAHFLVRQVLLWFYCLAATAGGQAHLIGI